MAESENAVFIATYATATAGTATALTQNIGGTSTSQRARSLVVRAKGANTGTVFVGASDVSSTVNEGILAGESLALTAPNWLDMGHFFIDVSTSGEGVDIYAIKA